MKSQVKLKHYFDKSYNAKGRFISYWHQIDEIIKLNSENVLEIGIGNAFVSKYLKETGINVTTMDFNSNLNPDIVGDVLNIPAKDKSFDIVACYEVLEHLPFEKFDKALEEIFRVSKSYALLSLPDVEKIFCLYVKIPGFPEFRKTISFPFFKKSVHRFDGEHYWEIGKNDYSLNRVVKNIEKTGFNVLRTYRVFENPYHRFFILKKTAE